jgi:hypothetical protein
MSPVSSACAGLSVYSELSIGLPGLVNRRREASSAASRKCVYAHLRPHHRENRRALLLHHAITFD